MRKAQHSGGGLLKACQQCWRWQLAAAVAVTATAGPEVAKAASSALRLLQQGERGVPWPARTDRSRRRGRQGWMWWMCRLVLVGASCLVMVGVICGAGSDRPA